MATADAIALLKAMLPDQEEFLSGEIAKILKCGRRSVQRWIDQGRIASTRRGPNLSRIVSREALLAFLVERLDNPVVADESRLAITTPKRKRKTPRQTWPDPPKLLPGSVLEAFETLYWPNKTRGRSKANYRIYRISIRHWRRQLEREPMLSDFTDGAISSFMAIRLEQGRTIETTNRDASTLVALWRWLAKKRIVEEFPTIQMFQRVRHTPKALTRVQLQNVFEAAGREQGTIGEIPANIWWQTLLLCIWRTGERIGAMMQINWADYDADTGWLSVRAEIRKGGRDSRAYELVPDAMEAMALLRANSPSYHKRIFPWPRNYRDLFGALGKIAVRAGLPDDRRHKFHILRRSFASHLKAAGGDPVEALGHSNVNVTRHSYLDPRIIGGKNPALLLFSIDGKGGA